MAFHCDGSMLAKSIEQTEFDGSATDFNVLVFGES